MNDATLVESRLATAAIMCGCATLLLRPSLMAAHGSTTLVVVLFAALLVIGLSAPTVGDVPSAATGTNAAVVIVIGCAAFILGRFVVDGDAIAEAVPRIVALNTLAAVAEEAFFRRLVYGWLDQWGAAIAVLGSTVLFAVVHVTVYGWWVLPIDVAAGFLFSWQRWATGTWSAPAATHAVANLLAVL